jgi:hypothetical protein
VSKNQIRGGSATCDLARFRQLAAFHSTDLPKAALTDSLALGYKYITPLGFSVCCYRRKFGIFDNP